VYPSVIESFGHPLLEAMAAGLPVVAADAPVNRELCGNSAVYFSPYDATDCARRIRSVIEDFGLAKELIRRGLERSRVFQWREHGAHLIAVFAARPRSAAGRN
jgi:glycosyltransferase involved in cell wall biosynthesis